MHYPVIDKNGLTVASAVTNLDLHDIARASKTYGAAGFFVVTPVEDQKALAERIISHWTRGAGSVYNPDRRDALALVALADDLAGVAAQVEEQDGQRPLLAATDARPRPDTVPEGAVRELLDKGTPVVLVLGTAWGLAREAMEQADLTLAPIVGGTDYNHLSVRSAAAIYLDRIMGRQP
ncbi:MAG: RNA methyltransferase [Thermodesulfobacteriota bacterium]